MKKCSLELAVLPSTYAVCRLDPKNSIPRWAKHRTFLSIAFTAEELSVVCDERDVPAAVKSEKGWKCFRVRGTMDMGLVGVMASLAVPLAEAGISLFTVATYDTDYFLVRKAQAAAAKKVLRKAGHRFSAGRRSTTRSR